MEEEDPQEAVPGLYYEPTGGEAPQRDLLTEFNNLYSTGTWTPDAVLRTLIERLKANKKLYAVDNTDETIKYNNKMISQLLSINANVSYELIQGFSKGRDKISFHTTFGQSKVYRYEYEVSLNNHDTTIMHSQYIIGAFYNDYFIDTIYDHMGLILSPEGSPPYFDGIAVQMEALRNTDRYQFNGALFNNLLYFVACSRVAYNDEDGSVTYPGAVPLITSYDPSVYVRNLGRTLGDQDTQSRVLTNKLTFGDMQESLSAILNNGDPKTPNNPCVRAFYEPHIHVIPFESERLERMFKIMPDHAKGNRRFFLKGARALKPNIKYINYGNWDEFKDLSPKMISVRPTADRSGTSKHDFNHLAYIDVKKINDELDNPTNALVIYGVYSYWYLSQIMARAMYYFPRHDILRISLKDIRTKEEQERKIKVTEEAAGEANKPFTRGEGEGENLRRRQRIMIITDKKKEDILKKIRTKEGDFTAYELNPTDSLKETHKFYITIMNNHIVQCNTMAAVEHVLNQEIKILEKGDFKNTGTSIYISKVIENAIIVCPFEAVRDLNAGDRVDKVYVDCWFKSQLFMDSFFERFFEGHKGAPEVHHCVPATDVTYKEPYTPKEDKYKLFVPDNYDEPEEGFTHEGTASVRLKHSYPHFDEKERFAVFVNKLIQILKRNYNVVDGKLVLKLLDDRRTSRYINYTTFYLLLSDNLKPENLTIGSDKVIVSALLKSNKPDRKPDVMTPSNSELLYTLNSTLENKDSAMDAEAFRRAVNARYEADGRALFDKDKEFVRARAHSLDHKRDNTPLNINRPNMNYWIYHGIEMNTLPDIVNEQPAAPGLEFEERSTDAEINTLPDIVNEQPAAPGLEYEERLSAAEIANLLNGLN